MRSHDILIIQGCYFLPNILRIITLVNNKFVVCIFLVDLGRIWCAESKNHIGFAQSGQVFEPWPHVVF